MHDPPSYSPPHHPPRGAGRPARLRPGAGRLQGVGRTRRRRNRQSHWHAAPRRRLHGAAGDGIDGRRRAVRSGRGGMADRPHVREDGERQARYSPHPGRPPGLTPPLLLLREQLRRGPRGARPGGRLTGVGAADLPARRRRAPVGELRERCGGRGQKDRRPQRRRRQPRRPLRLGHCARLCQPHPGRARLGGGGSRPGERPGGARRGDPRARPRAGHDRRRPGHPDLQPPPPGERDRHRRA